MKGMNDNLENDLMDDLFNGLSTELQEEIGNDFIHQRETFISKYGLQGESDINLFKNYIITRINNEFKWFLLFFIGTIEGQDFDFALHAQILCEFLQQHSHNNLKYDREAIISIAPGHSKTIIGNILYTSWLLGKDPAKRILVRTTADSMAVETNQKAATIMSSNAYKQVFGDIVHRWTNNTIDTHIKGIRGYRRSEPMSARVTGESAEFVLADDP